MTTIITKKGSGPPDLDSLKEAELAVDITNGDLYTKASGQIVKLNGEGGTGNGNPVVISDDPPEDPEEGDLWYCSKEDQEGLYCWDGAVWFGTESPNSVGLEEAPEDSKQYARRNASWSEVVIPEPNVIWEQDGDDIYYSDGKVSIGPPAPIDSFLLDVAGRGKFHGGISLNRNGGESFLLGQVDGVDSYQQRAIDGGGVRWTNGDTRTEWARIDADGDATFSGNVSIGTDTPLGMLHCDGLIVAQRISGTPVSNDVGGFAFNRNGSAMQGMYLNTSDELFIHNSLGTGKIKFTRAGGEATAVMNQNGNTEFFGNVTASGEIRGKQNVIAYYSDVRLKDIQGPIENPIEKVKAIETFYYTHGDRARELGYEGSEIQVGVSAQSVQAVAPELIHRAPVDDDGEGGSVTGESYMTVDYPRLVPLLIESIKQLSAEIEELKK